MVILCILFIWTYMVQRAASFKFLFTKTCFDDIKHHFSNSKQFSKFHIIQFYVVLYSLLKDLETNEF